VQTKTTKETELCSPGIRAAAVFLSLNIQPEQAVLVPLASLNCALEEMEGMMMPGPFQQTLPLMYDISALLSCSSLKERIFY
jgi:hypothetical protein